MKGRLLISATILVAGATLLTSRADARPDRTVRDQLQHERATWRAERGRLVRIIRQRADVQTALRLASLVYRVPLGQLERVSFCESTHRPGARNGRYRGLLQLGPIFEGTPYGQAGLSVWNPYVNVLAGAYIWRTGGQSWEPWECRP